VEILVNPDVFDPEFVTRAVAGADVVTTAVGPDFAKPHNPRSRLLSPPDLHQRLVRNLGVVGKDLLAMERELAASGLDWYAVRPVKLTDGPQTEKVRASDRFAMKTISRADVAWYLLELAEQPAPAAHRTPIITSADRAAGGTRAKPGVSATGSRTL
jgi:NAD(P)H-binding